MEKKELIICVSSIEELRAQLGVWASLCPCNELSIGIKVKMGPRQIEELFYKIWTAVGDEQFSKYIEAEGYKPIEKEVEK